MTVYDNLFKFVEDQRKERLSSKQDTLEGKIVKVVTEILNEAKGDSFNVPFQTIWNRLAEELDGKIDEKKPHVMETSEFFTVTKNKVGYRLREILSGKTKVLREKDPYGNWLSLKAYEFDPSKLRKVSKKYGYELVTKLQSLPSSEGTQAPESMEKTTSDNVEKEPYAPQQLSKLGNVVTTVEQPSSLQIEPSSISEKAVEKSVTRNKGSNSVTSVQEVLERVRAVFVEGTEEEWVKHAVEYGLSESEASRLFESLKGSELFWFERDGQTFWRWVRE